MSEYKCVAISTVFFLRMWGGGGYGTSSLILFARGVSIQFSCTVLRSFSAEEFKRALMMSLSFEVGTHFSYFNLPEDYQTHDFLGL